MSGDFCGRGYDETGGVGFEESFDKTGRQLVLELVYQGWFWCLVGLRTLKPNGNSLNSLTDVRGFYHFSS